MITLPNIGLYGKFEPCEQGVLEAINSNFLKLDVLSNMSSLGILSTAPTSVTDGDHYIDQVTGIIKIYNGGVWTNLQPQEGFLTYTKSDNKFYYYNGTSWVEFLGATSSDISALQAQDIIHTNDIAALDTRLDNLEPRVTSLESGNMTISGDKTYSGHSLFSKELDLAVLAVTPTNPSAGTISIYPKSDGFYTLDSAGNEKKLGSGGGGGAGANWVSGQTDGPLEDIEFNEKVFLFDTSLTQKVYLNLKLSANYSTGTRIRLIVKVYAPSLSTTNKAKLKLTSTLFKDGVTALGSTTNQNISQQEITIAGSNIPQTVMFDVTDAVGKINSVDLALNDSIQLELTRVAASASEEPTDLRFRPSTTEVLL